jgi:hypothetical protein
LGKLFDEGKDPDAEPEIEGLTVSATPWQYNHPTAQLSLVVAALSTMTIVSPGIAQPLGAPSSAAAAVPSDDPFDPSGLAEGPFSEMSTLLEVTIFKIDVLTLTIRVNGATAERLKSVAKGRSYSEELADSVAAVILDADDGWARQVFHRDVSLGRLVGGMRETAKKAAEAGFITQETFEEFSENVPAWFGFLEESGAKKGDEILFVVRGDRLRTVYRTVDGRVLMDEQAEGGEARRASIPSFYAPGTRFRKRLVESLLASESGA